MSTNARFRPNLKRNTEIHAGFKWYTHEGGGSTGIATPGHPATVTQKPKGAVMGIFPRQENNSVISSIAAVRQAWLEAVKAGDVEWLASLVTDDVVVVHGNG